MVATAARSPSHHKAVLTTTKRQPRRLRGRRSRADAARVGSTSPGLAALDLHLYRHRRTVSLESVHKLVHPVDHRLLESGFGLFDILLVALNDDLIVHGEDRHRSFP
jgi:hypothetical protein